MKLLLIGAASAAVLSLAGPAAAQYPPPPPPPQDQDQYQAPPNSDQDAMDPDQSDQDQDQAGPDDQYGPPPGQQAYPQDPRYGPPPGQQPPYGQPRYDQPQYGQPPYDRPSYGQQPSGPPNEAYAPGEEDQGPPAWTQGSDGRGGYNYGAPRMAGDDIARRADRLQRRIERLAENRRIDPHSADRALDDLRSVQDEDAQLESGGGLGPEDHYRLSQRLDRIKGMAHDLRSED